MVQNRIALDTEQQPRVIREDKNLIKKKEKSALLLQKWEGWRVLLMFVSVGRSVIADLAESSKDF